MDKSMKITAGWIGILIAFCGLSMAGGISTGAPAPEFALLDADGKEHNLSNYKGKYVVLEWVNYGCPFVKKHYSGGNMQALQKKYSDKDVVWFSICSSAPGKQGHASAEEIKGTNAKNGFSATAYLFDPDGAVGKKYGARTTPHLFVINPDGTVGYQGAIDSVRSTNPDDIPNAKNYVSDYLDLIMNGETPVHTTTKPYGCGVKYGT